MSNNSLAVELSDLTNCSNPQKFQNKGNTSLQNDKITERKQKDLGCNSVLNIFAGILVFFLIILSIIEIIHCCILFEQPENLLVVYIPNTTQVDALSPEELLLHKSHYEALFNSRNRKMVNFESLHKIDGELPYIESLNYYKNYSYIQQHQNLSLFINIPWRFGYGTSFSTLIDRSVTNKTVKEIYSDYKRDEVGKYYQNLQHQQPIHLMTHMPSLDNFNDPMREAKINEYFLFLADFIILFNPKFYQEGGSLNNTLTIRDNMVKLLTNLAEGNTFTKMHIIEIDFFFTLLFQVPLIVVTLVVACVFIFETNEKSRKNIITCLAVLGSAFFLTSILHCVIAVKDTQTLDTFQTLCESLFSFPEHPAAYFYRIKRMDSCALFNIIELISSFGIVFVVFSIFWERNFCKVQHSQI